MDTTPSRPTIELPAPSPGTVSLDRCPRNPPIDPATHRRSALGRRAFAPAVVDAGDDARRQPNVAIGRGDLPDRDSTSSPPTVSSATGRPSTISKWCLHRMLARRSIGKPPARTRCVTRQPSSSSPVSSSARRSKYGERSVRYVHIEVGHVGQNLMLEATALGLGTVPVGSFDDDAVTRVLALPSDHVPLYIFPVGHPTTEALRAKTVSKQSK